MNILKASFEFVFLLCKNLFVFLLLATAFISSLIAVVVLVHMIMYYFLPYDVIKLFASIVGVFVYLVIFCTVIQFKQRRG